MKISYSAVYVLLIIGCTGVYASNNDEMALDSIIFNYWCKAGVPPSSVDDLNLVIDTTMIYEGLNIDPAEYLHSVKFDSIGDMNRIIKPKITTKDKAVKNTKQFIASNSCSS